jgi:hypothetical protein
MFEPAFTGGGNIPNDIWNKAKLLSTYFKEEVGKIAQSKNIPANLVRIFQPCNAWAFLEDNSIHFAFSEINAGGLPRKIWQDYRGKGSFTTDAIYRAAVQNMSLENPIVISFESNLIPTYFEFLREPVDKFQKDHPEFEKNVFVAMRFREAEHFEKIFDSIKTELNKYHLSALRTDFKIYPHDDDLWDNVCVYMMGCSYGIFVFEDIDERSFNPNVPLEYGFMRALGKRVLLLKEKRMPNMPSDITGKIYKPFDVLKIEESISSQLKKWIENDLGISA